MRYGDATGVKDMTQEQWDELNKDMVSKPGSPGFTGERTMATVKQDDNGNLSVERIIDVYRDGLLVEQRKPE